MRSSIEKDLAALKHMTPKQLRAKYAELYGEPSRSGKLHAASLPRRRPIDRASNRRYISLHKRIYSACLCRTFLEAAMPAVSLESWVDDLQAHGRYTFLRAEAVRDSGLSAEAAGKALRRAVKSGRLVRLKEYFYVIVPLEYRAAGAPPISWFIHDLMAAMQQPYYIGLLSAAGLHGASHQQPQVFQVMTDRSVRPMVAGRARIVFFASKYVGRAATIEMKAPTGSMRVSSPETTVVDLVRFARAAGHLDHVASVIAQLAPALSPKRLVAALAVVHDIPNTQRLGYILDLLRQRKLSDSVHRWVDRRIERFQPLRPGQPVENARDNRRWHLLINGPLEIES